MARKKAKGRTLGMAIVRCELIRIESKGLSGFHLLEVLHQGFVLLRDGIVNRPKEKETLRKRNKGGRSKGTREVRRVRERTHQGHGEGTIKGMKKIGYVEFVMSRSERYAPC